MSRREDPRRKETMPNGWIVYRGITSGYRAVLKKSDNAKRRRRDKEIPDE